MRYHPRPVEPPIIKIESVLLLPEEQGAASGKIKVTGITPCLVETTDRVRVLGRITAKDKLKRLEWRSGDKDWKTLSGITADLKDSFDIKEELALIPNRQIIYFRAEAANDDSMEATQVQTLIIEYHPKLPDLRQLAAQPPGPIVKFGTEDGEAETIRLTAQLERVSLAAQLEIAPSVSDGPLSCSMESRRPGSGSSTSTAKPEPSQGPSGCHAGRIKSRSN